MSNAVAVALSGGLDSTCLLSSVVSEHETVHAVSFRYHSSHNQQELTAARHIADALSIPHSVIELEDALFTSGGRSSALTGSTVPDASTQENEHVVPCRNSIFASLLARFCEVRGYDVGAFGPTKTDRSVFPDCTPQFWGHMQKLVRLSTEGDVNLVAPFLELEKSQVIQKGVENNAPLHLTWTCYRQLDRHCGDCLACRERQNAFSESDASDPALYH